MDVDLLIVGGGINGAAIAREAALNGWRVMLVERGDLAGETSSRSTGLIHGGLRYLETYDIKLVGEALKERALLLRAAPHLIRPIRFVLPHENAVRPWWMVRAGLLLYDLLARGGTLPRSRSLRRDDAALRAPLKTRRGFVYWDARVDDARLVILNAIDAAAAGATIATRVALTGAAARGGRWHAALSDGRTVRARGIVNATGPWVMAMLALLGVDTASRVRLVRGGNIVVPRLYAGNHGYILQQPDRRIVFALPWEGATAIGTTDVPVDRPEAGTTDAQEIAYLCAAASSHFVTPVTPADVIGHWSGVRPLHDDGAGSAQQVSRDYALEMGEAAAPVMTVFGGKITTARHLAEEAVARLADPLGLTARPMTRDRPLPGGTTGDVAAAEAAALARWPFLGKARTTRMVRAYGAMLDEMLAGVVDADGMGRDFGAGLTEIEARWMAAREWARSADDALDRRSRLGGHITAAERAAFAAWWDGTLAVPNARGL